MRVSSYLLQLILSKSIHQLFSSNQCILNSRILSLLKSPFSLLPGFFFATASIFSIQFMNHKEEKHRRDEIHDYLDLSQKVMSDVNILFLYDCLASQLSNIGSGCVKG